MANKYYDFKPGDKVRRKQNHTIKDVVESVYGSPEYIKKDFAEDRPFNTEKSGGPGIVLVDYRWEFASNWELDEDPEIMEKFNQLRSSVEKEL